MDDIQQWLVDRQTLYSVLGSLYQDHKEKSIGILQKKILLQELVQSFIGTVLEDGAMQIIKEMDQYNYEEEYQELLGSDYRRLFTGPGHLLAPPWESFYRTKDKLLFGEPDRAVRNSYHAVGLEFSQHEPADHLALELAFMSRLCAMTVADSQYLLPWLGKQEEFLQEHLLQWVPAWANDVIHNAQTEFWKGIAAITQEWLKNDAAEIEATREVYAEG